MCSNIHWNETNEDTHTFRKEVLVLELIDEIHHIPMDILPEILGKVIGNYWPPLPLFPEKETSKNLLCFNALSPILKKKKKKKKG